MGHWGWRPLVVSTFLSVWVAGCNLLSDSAASTQTPSPYPLVTLTVGRASRASPRAPTAMAATASPALSAPAHPATAPTAEPTAAVYTVQPGDTALDIALRNGIDLPALRAANGGQMLSILTIGQTLVIPPPSGSPTQIASLPTVAPLALTVEAPTCTPLGDAESLCLGRVLNGQSVAASNIELTVTVLDTSGAESRVVLAIEQGVLPVDGWAPYRAQLPVPPEQIAGLTVEVSSAGPAAEPAAVEVRDSRLAYRDGRGTVSAMLHNPGRQPVSLARAVVTLLAADGRVLGYRVTPLEGRLAPGQQVPFETTVVALGEAGLLPRVQISIEAQAGP